MENGGGRKRIIFPFKLNWMKESKMAVIVSEEQARLTSLENGALTSHRTGGLSKTALNSLTGHVLMWILRLRKEEHPFRTAIVCAMWLTGFDVPSLANLYLDKPLKAHTLMQAIARANRVNKDKNNGLIVDYCGILKIYARRLPHSPAQAIPADPASSGLMNWIRPEPKRNCLKP